jgi:hypothetical protein
MNSELIYLDCEKISGTNSQQTAMFYSSHIKQSISSQYIHNAIIINIIENTTKTQTGY